MKRKHIAIRMPVALWEKVALAADFLGLTKTSYVILALTDRLKKDMKSLEENDYKWKRN